MFNKIYLLVEKFVKQTSKYIHYDALEDKDFSPELNPTYFDDVNTNNILEISLHIYLVYMKIRPACMVLSDIYIYNKRNEVYNSCEYTTFTNDLETLINLKCTFSSVIDNNGSNGSNIIIYNPKIENIHLDVQQLQLINNNENNNEYHLLIGKILGYLHCNSPAKIRINDFYNIVIHIDIYFQNKLYNFVYFNNMCPLDKFNEVYDKFIEYTQQIHNVLTELSTNVHDVHIYIKYDKYDGLL